MDYNAYHVNGKDVLLTGVSHASLDEIFGCGQAFRWTKIEGNAYHGIAAGRELTITEEFLQKEEDNQQITLCFHDTSTRELEDIWLPYFDFTENYGERTEFLSQNPTLRKAIRYAPGIRILKQDPWETLCTFILSQNNNIKRIQGLVQRLSQEFGVQISDSAYAFPTPEALSARALEDLAPVRAGFRGKYLLDAAKQVTQGSVSLTAPYTLPLPIAREQLERIYGVGPKVADCVLLFGFGRLESFPLDVWMKRAVKSFYPKGFPKKYLPYAGLAQQYLFHYARQNPHLVAEEEKGK